MKSIWQEETTISHREKLAGKKRVDAVVVGAGMAGILTAFFLQQQGLSTVILEADRIGSGQTRNTTAKITSQHNLIYTKLQENVGEEQAWQYARANEKAIQEYKELIADRSISCSFKELPAYAYTTQDGELQREAELAHKMGIQASYVQETKLPFAVKGAVRFENQAQFQPLEFIKMIAEDLEIYECTQVLHIEGKKLRTTSGEIQADHIVMATHYPFINRPGYYFMRMHQERSYVLGLKGADNIEGMYIGVDDEGYSFRNYGEYLLLGGGKHRTGEGGAGRSYEKLEKAAKEYYPESEAACRWSAQDCMTLDGIPYIGMFSRKIDNMYVATGFGKWGMTSSMVSAHIIRDMIIGRENPYAEVFSPQRFHAKASASTLLEDGMKAVKGMGLNKLSLAKENIPQMNVGEGGVVEYEGQKAGVYKEDEDKMHVVEITCPHLGCELTWNANEKSWDCPCHGSRFDYKGRLLSGPALEGVGYEEI